MKVHYFSLISTPLKHLKVLNIRIQTQTSDFLVSVVGTRFGYETL